MRQNDHSSADGPAPPSPTSTVVAVAGRNTNRSVLLRQRSLSLDNDKPPPKRGRLLFQKLRTGCSNLVHSTPVDLYNGSGFDPESRKTAGCDCDSESRKAVVSGRGGGVCPTSAAPVEFKGIMSELRRSSDVVRAILWNLSFRDAYTSGGSNDGSDRGSSDELDVDTLFDRHEQRRYADYELENGGLPPPFNSLSSLQSFQSLSSAGSPASDLPASDPVAAFRLQPSPPTLPVTEQPQVAMDYDNASTLLTAVPKLVFKSSMSLDKINEMADVYTKRYLNTLPPLFLAAVRQNSTVIYLLLKYGASPNFQVSISVTLP